MFLPQNRPPRRSAPLSREERDEKQQTYLLRAALLGLPGLAGAGYLLFRLAWWLPLVFAAVCALMVVGRMLYRPKPIRLNLDR